MSTAAQLVAQARDLADSIPEDPAAWRAVRELKKTLRELAAAVTPPAPDLIGAQRARAAHTVWAEGPAQQPADVVRHLAEDTREARR